MSAPQSAYNSVENSRAASPLLYCAPDDLIWPSEAFGNLFSSETSRIASFLEQSTDATPVEDAPLPLPAAPKRSPTHRKKDQQTCITPKRVTSKGSTSSSPASSSRKASRNQSSPIFIPKNRSARPKELPLPLYNEVASESRGGYGLRNRASIAPPTSVRDDGCSCVTGSGQTCRLCLNTDFGRASPPSPAKSKKSSRNGTPHASPTHKKATG